MRGRIVPQKRITSATVYFLRRTMWALKDILTGSSEVIWRGVQKRVNTADLRLLSSERPACKVGHWQYLWPLLANGFLYCIKVSLNDESGSLCLCSLYTVVQSEHLLSFWESRILEHNGQRVPLLPAPGNNLGLLSLMSFSIGNTSAFSQLIAGGIKPVLYASTRRGLLEVFCLVSVDYPEPFPSAGFALYPLAEINLSHECDYMPSPVSSQGITEPRSGCSRCNLFTVPRAHHWEKRLLPPSRVSPSNVCCVWTLPKSIFTFFYLHSSKNSMYTFWCHLPQGTIFPPHFPLYVVYKLKTIIG